MIETDEKKVNDKVIKEALDKRFAEEDRQTARNRAELLLGLHARRERAEQLEAEDKRLDGELEMLKGQEYQRGE